ncbi:uncharacterized protein LOC143367219 [Andrena cerasifolii]|uniref:uncharacterized protein LOC143367219 n=1 Tax=Andrena cerasifolii TaxID=2819439 RepID=UPI004037AEC4
MREIQFHGTNIHYNVDFSIHVSRPLSNDPNCSQYHKIEFNNISLGINTDMSQREKRVVTKPIRYQTTSSEKETPKRRRTSTAPRPTINQDIQDLSIIMQEDGPTTSNGVPTVNSDNMFQDTYAANVPVFEAFADPGTTSSARATVIHSEPLRHNTASTQPPDNGSMEDLTERNRIEAELIRMNTLLLSIQKSVQATHNTGQPMKPAVLPLSSVQEVDCFEDIDDDTYSKVVQYFKYVGGFNLKAAVDFCMKEALIDDVTTSFTWFGRTGKRPLYNARITMAIYEAGSGNPHFGKPLRSDFQVSMQRALRIAKERVRSRKRGARATAASTDFQRRRDFWSDQQPEEEADDL